MQFKFKFDAQTKDFVVLNDGMKYSISDMFFELVENENVYDLELSEKATGYYQ